jgi:hypothetical protein
VTPPPEPQTEAKKVAAYSLFKTYSLFKKVAYSLFKEVAAYSLFKTVSLRAL